jgi:hypothetical protein
MTKGKSMEPTVKTYENTYNILVKETHDHHLYEWVGNLMLVLDGDGDTYIDLTFNSQPAWLIYQDQPQDPASPCLSIECIEAESIPANPKC